jgi:hypothetical protein
MGSDFLGWELRRLFHGMCGKAYAERTRNTNDRVKARLCAWRQRLVEAFSTQT